MKKGILGGSFNPIHCAHLELAKAAKEQFGLDELLLMPSKKPTYKDTSDLESEAHRYNMVKLAAKSLGGEKAGYIASDFEYKREGNTYTYETLQLLHKLEPDTEWYFIIGGDSLKKFCTWVKPEIISGLCTLLVAGRDGISDSSLRYYKNKIIKKFGGKVEIIKFMQLDVSSTKLRECLSKADDSEFIPPEVMKYIKKNHLYGVN